MELDCRGKWASFIAAVIIFGCQLALVFSKRKCPSNSTDVTWSFLTKPDRCITAYRNKDNSSDSDGKYRMSYVRENCRKQGSGFFIVDLLSIPDMETFITLCNIMPLSKAFTIGLIKHPTTKDYYWVATREKAQLLPWRNKTAAQEEEEEKVSDGNDYYNKFDCAQFAKNSSGECELVAANCDDLGRNYMCSTYQLNPCDQDNGDCPSETLCRYAGPMARECICTKNSTYIQARKQCECSAGFVRKIGNNNKPYCEDINECSNTDNSHNVCGERCVNTAGSYHCNCNGANMVQKLIHMPNRGPCLCEKGYKLSQDDDGLLKPTKGCVDINECDTVGKTKCKELCVNTIGSYRCECTGQNFATSKHEKNNPQCVCETGYRLSDNAESCIDFNECFYNGQNLCAKDQYCKNTQGNYTCCYFDSDRNNHKLCAQTAKAEQESESPDNTGFLVGMGFLVVALAAGVVLFAAHNMSKRNVKGGRNHLEKEGNVEKDEDDAENEENVEASEKEDSSVGENVDDVSMGTDIDVSVPLAK